MAIKLDNRDIETAYLGSTELSQIYLGTIELLSGVTFLLRDDFLTDEAAPIASPRTAEPGPGTWTVADSASKFSISGGTLSYSSGTGSGDPALWGGSQTRAVGLAHFGSISLSATSIRLMHGWSNDTSGFLDEHGVYFRSGELRVYAPEVNIGNHATLTTYLMAVILRTAGAFFFINGGVWNDWTLIWFNSTKTTTTVYPAITAIGFSGIPTVHYARVSQLAAPFDTDYGIATDTHTGNVAASTTMTHEADSIFEFTVTTVPSSGNIDRHFRIQDASNYWIARVTSGGKLDLIEVVAGSPTSRGSGGTVTNGERIVIVADDTTITGYADNTQAWTYSSASNFKTETAGKLDTLGTGGAVSDDVVWPRTLSGAAKAALDAVANA